MSSTIHKPCKLAAIALTVGLLLAFIPAPSGDAADHFDAPFVSSDQGADMADVYAFVDPVDNNKVDLAMTVQGFIVPGEAVNGGAFDANVRYRLMIENTGDARPDAFVDVTFSERTSTTTPQTATISLPNGRTFTAPTTLPSATATTPPTPVVTTDATSGVAFYAGLNDDPFFFDIPGFNRFVASVLAGTPNVSALDRGRDTFAGYNVKGFALSIPKALLLGSAGATIGVEGVTQRRNPRIITSRGEIATTGRYVNVDRMGLPAVNVALIPFARKNEYNAASPVDDANGRFASSIVATLTALGTNSANQTFLANLAIVKGDYLRLDTSLANTGPGGGTNAGSGFPNGRRLNDDVIDVILNVVTNGGVTAGDHVNANDVTNRDTFPYFGLQRIPLGPGVTDDLTRN
jgi:Domain of unknown function (DUF4331)